jgi:hypothetical protein
MKPSVYIETSVLSALVDRRDDPVSESQRIITRDWWATQRRHYRLFSSQFLMMELEKAEFPGQAEALMLAAHLAIACLNEVDYLLTWNCRHLANPNKIRHIQVVNMRMGLLTPILVTPQMLWVEESEK